MFYPYLVELKRRCLAPLPLLGFSFYPYLGELKLRGRVGAVGYTAQPEVLSLLSGIETQSKMQKTLPLYILFYPYLVELKQGIVVVAKIFSDCFILT